MPETIDAEIGALQAQVKAMQCEIAALRADIREVRDVLLTVRGSWKALSMMAACAGFAGALAARLLPAGLAG